MTIALGAASLAAGAAGLNRRRVLLRAAFMAALIAGGAEMIAVHGDLLGIAFIAGGIAFIAREAAGTDQFRVLRIRARQAVQRRSKVPPFS